jgi:hypothetical protein
MSEAKQDDPEAPCSGGRQNHPGQGTSVDCTVRNFSSAGAALWLKNGANLPAKFDLNFDNATWHCTVVWLLGRCEIEVRALSGAVIVWRARWWRMSKVVIHADTVHLAGLTANTRSPAALPSRRQKFC